MLIVAFTVFTACQSVTRDGVSAERAVRLHAADHGAGLLAEHAWLNLHFPGFRLAEGGVDSSGEEVVHFAHRTETRDHAILSVYTIQLPDGRVIDVFFDQSGYFGKKEPNQTPEPTPPAGTSAAEQPLVPAAVVAHL